MSDLISRQAAINAIEFGITYARAFNKETGEVRELFQESNGELRKAVERIKQLPSIQPKRGKWIDKGITGDWQYQIDGRGRSWHEWQCDQCKDMVKKRSFYCPNCGADMREVTT